MWYVQYPSRRALGLSTVRNDELYFQHMAYPPKRVPLDNFLHMNELRKM